MNLFEDKYLFAGVILILIAVAFIPFFIGSEHDTRWSRFSEIRGNTTISDDKGNLSFFGDRNNLSIPSGRRNSMPFYFVLSPVIMLLIIPLAIIYSNRRMEKRLSESIEILSKLVSKNTKTNRKFENPSLSRELATKLLNPQEMAVVERLLESPKGVPQIEITGMPGMTKLRAHRIIERLKSKGIVSIKKVGKTNIVKMDERTRNILLK